MALVVRSARPADWAAIAELHVASWRDAYRGLMPPDFLAGPVERELTRQWRETLGTRRRAGAVMLAVASREVAGFVAAWQEGSICHIDHLHVRPGLRGAGIGRRLLGAAARRLRDQGARSADLWVFAANHGALRFYHRLGGQVGPVVERETFGQALPERCVTWSSIGPLLKACGEE
jgi:ribosomal protein S18 acetylase RimI-like enzyme